jgi:multidrug efflux pump
VKLSEISIRRPVLATVMSLVIVLFGVLSWLRLPVREYPDIDPPVVSINTLYRGASPSVVETEITDVLEEQLATIEGIRTITSSSREQGSTITVEFELNRDVDVAANDVRDRVSRVRAALPAEADDPIVAKVDTNAQPIFWVSLSSDRHSQLELSELADVVLTDRIQRLPGVANVFIGAERRYAMRVWLDPQRMAAYGLTTADVERAIRAGNAEIPGGRVEGEEREFSVRTRGDLATPEEFAAIIVAQSGGRIVRLGEVADVEVGPEDERSVARFNGHPSIGLGIVKQSQASTLEVARAVREALPALREELAPGMELNAAYDSSVFIQNSIEQVRQTVLIAMALVFVVVLAFLKSFRATLVPAVAMPISLIGSFAILYFLGFTINILTLLALVLAVGLVVDDAIVMLENIYRHMEMGKSRRRAAFDGAKEIGFAIIATSLALVAVFIPVAFLQGNVGRLFVEFAIAIAFAVAVSSFVALTLSPMLCSRFLRPLHGGSQSWASRSFDRFFDWLEGSYASTLEKVVRLPVVIVGVVVLLVVAAGFLFTRLPSELVPTEDRSVAFGVVIAPEGATLEYTDRYVRQLEQILLNTPEHEALFAAIGLGFGGPGRVTNGFIVYRIKDPSQRDRSQQEIVQSLFPKTFSIPGVLAFLVNPPSLGGRFNSSPVEYVLQADSYDELGQAVGALMGKASQLGYLVNLDSDLRLNKPQLEITIDRERAAELGVSVTDVGGALETLLGGRVVTDFKRGSKQYDVLLQVRPTRRSTPDVIPEVYVRGDGGLVQLANVVSVKETVAPKELNHYNRIRSATITANLAPGVSLGQALDDLDRIRTEDLPAGIRREFAGQSREFKESSRALYVLFVLALVFIYLVLAAQFESFVHPLTILFSVPLAVVGALASLALTGQTLNIYSQIGLIMLIGLVTKNSILIVEFSNQLRARGRSTRDAVIEAGRIRLRPILMTSFSTIFGVLPIALGLGAGGEARAPLGIAVVGGMFFSTFLTLLIVPVVYLLLARFTPAKPVAAEAEDKGQGRVVASPEASPSAAG